MNRGKRKQGERNAVESSVHCRQLKRTKMSKETEGVLELEDLKGHGIRVVSWDGM